MPNKVDRSVKMMARDRDTSIRNAALLTGVVLAAAGAIAAMLAGGPYGKIVGISAFILLVATQGLLFWRARHGKSPSPDTRKKEFPGTASAYAIADAELLLISVSDLGRIRWVWGNNSLLPSARAGRLADSVLDDLASQGSLQARNLRSSEGELILILPAEHGDKNAKQQLRERTEFFAGLGHDLKSPLNAVIGFADIMAAEIKGPLPEAYSDYPGLIRESGQVLLRLVEDMLDYAKSEAGHLELDRSVMDIAASGESVMRQSEEGARQKGVKLRFEGQHEVLASADANAIRRIWDNLVSNAIKYSSSGQVVTLKVEQRDDGVVMSVRDMGAGMDESDLERIAAPFEQGRNARGRAGTGLGLAMVKRLAELHDGKVTIRTAPGQGTLVRVVLPALRAAQKRAAE